MLQSINPGFGGQKFIDNQLRKIEAVRKRIDAIGKDIILEVDGGVTGANCARVIAAGATALVAGTAVFGDGPEKYAANIARLRGA